MDSNLKNISKVVITVLVIGGLLWAEPVWERLLGLEFRRPDFFVRPEDGADVPPMIEIIGGLSEHQEPWVPDRFNRPPPLTNRSIYSEMRGSGYSMPRDFLLFRDSSGLVLRTEETGWLRLDVSPFRMRSSFALAVREEREVSDSPPLIRSLDLTLRDVLSLAERWRRSAPLVRPMEDMKETGEVLQVVAVPSPSEVSSPSRFRSTEVVIRGGEFDLTPEAISSTSLEEIAAREEGWRFGDSPNPVSQKKLAQVDRETSKDNADLSRSNSLIAKDDLDEKKRAEFQPAPIEKVEDRRFAPIQRDSYILTNEEGGRMYAPGFRLSRFDLRLAVETSMTYNDNLFLAPKGAKKESDIMASVVPSFEAAVGEKDPSVTDALSMAFRYSPTILAFLSHTEEATMNQDFALGGGYRFSRLSLGIDVRASDVTGGDVERADFLNRKIYQTSLLSEYELSELTTVELAGNLVIRDFEQGFNSNDVATRGYLNYELFPKLRLGGGLGFGSTQSKGTTEQYYQQLLARAVYVASEKTSVFGEGGLEVRQFANGVSSQGAVIFRGGGAYQVFPKTSISISTSRHQSSSSALFGQNILTTSIGSSVRQTIERGSVNLSLSFQNVEYVSVDSGVSAQREDLYTAFGLGGAYPVLEWMDLGAFYTHSFNRSNVGISEFDNNQIGVSSQIRF